MLTDFNHQSLLAAAKALRDGKLVSFPTETVYGLGADATNDDAVAAIYKAKGRPSFNPLIAHVPDFETAQHYADFDDLSTKLAAIFWPGPLTIIRPIKDNSKISPLVTAGLPTLALRVPAPEKARALLAQTGRPVAAPSANLSGRISPTKADHVAASLDDDCAYILDDGPCQDGLESTIIAPDGNQIVILRPGPVTAEMLKEAMPDSVIITKEEANDSTPSSPGQMSSHYAPTKPVRLHATAKQADEVYIGFGEYGKTEPLNLSPDGNLIEAASNLFAYLHEADKIKGAVIAVAPLPETGIGKAITDRLLRAATGK